MTFERSVVQDIDLVSSGAASFIHCNVSDEGNVRDAIVSALSIYGKLDILFSNAGTGGGKSALGSIMDADADVVRRMFEVNVMGVFHCSKYTARAMVEGKTRGIMLFMPSAVSKMVVRGTPHGYTTSKTAVVGLTRGLAVELGQHGIRVNCVQ